MKLSKNFYLEEFTRSEYATRHNIINEPNENEVVKLKQLCNYTLQPLRDYIDKIIHIKH